MTSKARDKRQREDEAPEPANSVTLESASNPESTDYETRKEHYRYYREERKSLIDAERDIAKMFDQLLLAIASGVLTLSVSNAEKIVKFGVWKLWLGVSWALLVLTSLCTLLSLLLSQHNWKVSRENLDLEQNCSESSAEISDNSKAIRKGVIGLNWAGLFFFITSLIIIAAVAYKNLI